jgi:hypothetical protein
MESSAAGVTLTLSRQLPDARVTVVALDIEGEPQIAAPPPAAKAAQD